MSELTRELVEGWFHVRYANVAPATWNRELATLRSAVTWWRAHGWLAAHSDPTAGLVRRREHPDRTRAQLEALWRRSDLRLRDKTLWLLMYETAAGPARRSTSMSPTSTWPTSGPGWCPRAARSSGSTGRPQPPGCLPAWSPGGPAAPCSSPIGHRPFRSRPATSTRSAGGPGCRTGVPPTCSIRQQGGRCTSCATQRSPTKPRMAPTRQCRLPAPATPRSARWSATLGPAQRRSPATSRGATRPPGGLDREPDVAMWGGTRGQWQRGVGSLVGAGSFEPPASAV
jgi:hypothetical protein